MLTCAVRLASDRPPGCCWAQGVLDILEERRPDPAAALVRATGSPFSGDVSARVMEQVYLDCVSRGRHRA